MSEQVKQDPIEDGLAMSTQLIEPKSNIATGKEDQQLQDSRNSYPMDAQPCTSTQLLITQ